VFVVGVGVVMHEVCGVLSMWGLWVCYVLVRLFARGSSVVEI